MTDNIQHIIEENQRRHAELNKPYNPYTGLGSSIKRELLEFRYRGQEYHVFLPVSMFEIPLIQTIKKKVSFEDVLKDLHQYSESALTDLYLGFLKERIKHDFEFWAATSVQIKDKETGNNISFVLNRAQRRLLVRLEKMRLAGVPIRIILLKARQWGGSTLIQVYAGWIQNVHKQDSKWNSVIVADVEGQTRNIRAMYRNLSKHYPKLFGTITFVPFEGSSKNIQIKETESVVSIGSMQKPESLRSDDIKIVHFSEIGLWKATASKTPDDLSQAVKSSVPKLPYTMIAEESTAKGVGNHFHISWTRALDGLSGYDPVFIPWYEIERYQKPINDYVLFIQSMNEYDWFLWKSGATLEGINWYNDFFQSELKGDAWSMKSEFPTTWEEAFQSTGNPVFHPSYLVGLEIHTKVPFLQGYLQGDASFGKNALINLKFLEHPTGSLKIWSKPISFSKDPVKNRYVVSLDIGGRRKTADKSIITVIDRIWMLDGDGELEVAASAEFNMDPDLTVWFAVQVAQWYNSALFVPEANVIKSKYEETDGDHILTVLNNIVEVYSNIFTRVDQEKVIEGVPQKYGYWTSVKSKTSMIDNMIMLLRENMFIEREPKAIAEFKSYEKKDDGTWGGAGKMHDDYVMSRMIAADVAVNHMEAPKRITINPYGVRERLTKHKITGEASI